MPINNCLKSRIAVRSQAALYILTFVSFIGSYGESVVAACCSLTLAKDRFYQQFFFMPRIECVYMF